MHTIFSAAEAVRFRISSISLIFALLFSLLILPGCGGGGGGVSESLDTPGTGTTPQSIAFETSGDFYTAVGRSVTNTATGGQGSRAVTYTSSDEAVAQVDATTGAVTPLAVGQAIVTATKPADDTYATATASYTLYVGPEKVAFTAYVGKDDSVVSFPELTPSLTNLVDISFDRTSNMNCTPGNFATCDNGASDILDSGPITDEAATLSQAGYYMLRYGDLKSRVATVSFASCLPRAGHQTVSHDGKLWVLGGYPPTNEVWASTDARGWQMVTVASGFPPSEGFGAVSFQGKLWILGGKPISGINEPKIWYSEDGQAWTSADIDPVLAERSNHRMVVFKDKLWVIGGARGPEATDDVWYSDDGLAWTRAAKTDPWFSPRYVHNALVHDGKLWVLGGLDADGDKLHDAWFSDDGLSWTRVGGNALPFFGPGQVGVTHGGRMWLYGGDIVPGGHYSTKTYASVNGVDWAEEGDFTAAPKGGFTITAHGGRLFDVGGGSFQSQPIVSRSSVDGVTWIEEKSETGYEQRSGDVGVAFDDALWMVGGHQDGPGTPDEGLSEVLRSTDGTRWHAPPLVSGFSHLKLASVTVHDNAIWRIGGQLNEFAPGTDEVWRSVDGVTWTKITPAGSLFSSRFDHQSVEFMDRLWVVGGRNNLTPSGFERFNDVWSTTDGSVWDFQGTAEFSPRRGHRCVVFNNELLVMGGTATEGISKEIWGTMDGVSWTQKNDADFLAGRSGFSAAVFKGNLYVVGGAVSATYKNDVWVSIDAQNWNEVPGTMLFEGRKGHSLVVKGETMYLMGGFSSEQEIGDVWATTDGENWRRAFASEIRLK